MGEHEHEPGPGQDSAGPTLLPLPVELPKTVTLPHIGQIVTSFVTGNTYTMGEEIGEGNFSRVFGCTDSWENQLAAKVLKPYLDYETVKNNALREFQKLLTVRHPFVTYVHDAFELDDTFYIITERCHRPLSDLMTIENFQGHLWLRAIARCLLQAVDFVKLNGMVHKDIHLGNVFTNFQQDEMIPDQHRIVNFKLGDLGIANFVQEIRPGNTILANWMQPPEALDPDQFGPMDHRIDIYHCGLLFLQILHGADLRFSREQILEGAPRQMALQLPLPYSVALEKALRRHVEFRTASGKELWRDLNSPPAGALQLAVTGPG